MLYSMGDGKFLKSLYIVSPNLLILWKPLIYCLALPFSNPPHPHFPVNSNIHSHCSFSCHVSLAEWWSYHIWSAFLLTDNMDLYISSFGTLLPEGPWYVFHATRRQVYWSLTSVFILVLWFDITHTHLHTQTLRDQWPYRSIWIYIYTTCYVLTTANLIALND